MNNKSNIMNNNVQFFIKKFGNDVDCKILNSKYSTINGIKILIKEWCKLNHNYNLNNINIQSLTIIKIMSEVDMTQINYENFWNKIE